MGFRVFLYVGGILEGCGLFIPFATLKPHDPPSQMKHSKLEVHNLVYILIFTPLLFQLPSLRCYIFALSLS